MKLALHEIARLVHEVERTIQHDVATAEDEVRAEIASFEEAGAELREAAIAKVQAFYADAVGTGHAVIDTILHALR